jgi:hypothetical protein
MPHRNVTQKSVPFGFNPYTQTGVSPASRARGSIYSVRFVSNMKPLKAEAQDAATLRELGRASVQIVHDLKNQLNGLKLYATFLRKRMEKSERPQDELETIDKITSGLERAASDMTTLVRYGRPVELKRQPRTDLTKILLGVLNEEDAHNVTRGDVGAGKFDGEFDQAALTEALKAIHVGAQTLRPQDADSVSEVLRLRREETGGKAMAVIEWPGIKAEIDDPFHSFAGSNALRMSLAAKVIEAHGGEARPEADALTVRLPLEIKALETDPLIHSDKA